MYEAAQYPLKVDHGKLTMYTPNLKATTKLTKRRGGANK